MTSPTGGCLGKIESDALLTLLQAAGLPLASRGDFEDAVSTALPPGANTIATSTDLIFDFGLEATELGWAAVVHALSDVYAVLADPLAATVCLGVPRSRLLDGSAGRILRGVADALTDAGAHFAGGHSVYSDPTFVAVSVVANQPRIAGCAWDPHASYVLVLSKPIGTGIYIAGERNGLLGASERTELTRRLRESNAGSARSLLAVAGGAEGALAFVTDVTGFGLLLALEAKVPPGWVANVAASTVPMMSRTEALFMEHGLVTTLGERNMLTARDDDSFDFGTTATSRLLALSDPQTSGGLLAAVREDLLDEIGHETGVDWVRIGAVVHGKSGSAGHRVLVA